MTHETNLGILVDSHRAADIARSVIHSLSGGKVRLFSCVQTYAGDTPYYMLQIETARKPSMGAVESCRQWVAAALIGADMRSAFIDNAGQIDLAR